MASCPNCGAENRDDAIYCAACGGRLNQRQRQEETVIDITTGEPAIVVDEPETPSGRFASSQIGRVRVYTAQSRSPAVCLVPVGVVLLVLVCACIGFFAVVDNVVGF